MKSSKFFAMAILLTFGQISSSKAQIWKPVQLDERQLNSRYLLAQQLERSGQLQQAAEIYKSLFDLQPANTSFYSSYSNLLFALKNYPELERVINMHLQLNPRNENAAVDRGRLFYLRGDTTAAYSAWNQALEQFTHSVNFYRTLFNCYASLQLYQAGENLVKAARQYHNKPDLFALELANFYAFRGAYLAATREYLLFGQYNPRSYQMIGAQILRLEVGEQAFAPLDSLIQKEIQKQPSNPDLHRLRSEFLFKFKDYSGAIDEMFTVESLSGYRGSAILDLLRDLSAIQEYAVAESLCTIALDQPPLRHVAPQILLNLADITEKEVLSEGKISPMNYFYSDNLFFNTPFIQRVPSNLVNLQRAFQIYDSLITKLPRSEYTSQALFRLADLRFTVVRDFDGAINLYRRAENTTRDYTLRQRCRQRIGEVYLAQGAIESAWQYFNDEATQQEGTDYEKSARIYAAMSAYLSGQIDSTLTLVGDLVMLLTPAHPDFNDVVEFESFLRTNCAEVQAADRKAFEEFVKAERLLRQNKLSEAGEAFKFLLNQFPAAKCSAPARFRLAQIELLFNNFAVADSLVQKLMADGSELSAAAVFMLAETADIYYHDLRRAAQWYNVILEKYPDSLQIAEVRKRLREIQKILETHKES